MNKITHLPGVSPLINLSGPDWYAKQIDHPNGVVPKDTSPKTNFILQL